MPDLRSLIQALQGNFDHLMGTIRELAGAHNVVVEDINEIVLALEDANLEIDGKWTEEEHAALADGSPHHAAVTVGTGLDIADQHITLSLDEVAEWVDLTDGGATVLHSHAGGGGGSQAFAFFIS